MRELRGLKVCFLAGTLGQGGAERQLFYMLSALKQAGALPRVLCLTDGEHWQQRIESLGIKVTWVGQSRFRLLRLRKIIEELKRDPPDVFQSQHFFANIYVTAAARLLGLQDIGAVRSDGVGELGANHGILGRWSLKHPRIIAANSRAGIENAVRLGAPRERMFFLSNVVDTTVFSTPASRSNARVRLLTVGRLVSVKRFDRFLRAVAAVRDHSSIPVEGLIVGDGPLRQELQAEAARLGLSPNEIRFCGTADETGQFYLDADILVLTSDREGTPNVVLEAMASGLPVVATRVGGLPALIRDGETGYLADQKDEAHLAAAIRDLVEHPEKRAAFGQRARAFVQEHHDLPQLTAELRRLYDVALSRPRAETIRADKKNQPTLAERLVVVTNVVHYRHEGRVFAYAPYVLEIQSWATLFPRLVLASPCRRGAPPGDCLPLPHNVSIVPQVESGGETLRAKFVQLAMLPYSVARLILAMGKGDALHVRCPGNLGLLGAMMGPMFHRKRIAKFAGEWAGYKGEPWTVGLQRRILRSRWWGSPVMAYTDGKNEPGHVISFFNSSISSGQMARARAAAITRTGSRPAKVLYAGRLTHAKNVHVLVDAIAAVIRDGIDVSLKIVGDGPERIALENRVTALGIQQRVTVAGGVAPDAVFDHYEAADVLVLASETEGWPKTLTEGMAFGLICIGSNRGLIRMMLADGRGVLVEPAQPDSLADALRSVIRMAPQDLHSMRDRASAWGGRFTTEEFRDALRAALENGWRLDREPRMRSLSSPVSDQARASRVGVMHVTDTLEIGGAERMAVSLANSLPRARFEPHVCTTRRSGPLADTIEADVAVFSLNRRRTFDVSALRRFVAYIRLHNIQVLHAHGSSVFVCALASMFRPYPRVVWHIHYGRHSAEQSARWSYRLIKRRVSRSIAVSEPLAVWARQVVGMPADSVTYIPNFSLLTPPTGSALSLPGKRGSRLVCVANFLPEKDHINLLRAMEIVVKVRPDAHLLLVGGGTNSACESGARAHIESAGLDGNVTFLGQRRDVSEILRAVDIGVLSSQAEGLPLALIEYGEAGLPVVVTAVGQCEDVVDWGRAGIIVLANDPAELANGILSLLMAPERSRQMGDQLRQRVQHHFSGKRITERVYRMYAS